MPAIDSRRYCRIVVRPLLFCLTLLLSLLFAAGAAAQQPQAAQNDDLQLYRMESIERRIDNAEQSGERLLIAAVVLAMLLLAVLFAGAWRAYMRWHSERLNATARNARQLMRDIKTELDRPQVAHLRTGYELRRIMRRLRKGAALSASDAKMLADYSIDGDMPASLFLTARALTAQVNGDWRLAAKWLDGLVMSGMEDDFDVILHLAFVHDRIAAIAAEDAETRRRHLALSKQYYAQFAFVLPADYRDMPMPQKASPQQETEELQSADIAKPPPPQKAEETQVAKPLPVKKAEALQVAKPPPKESQESKSVEVAKPPLQESKDSQSAGIAKPTPQESKEPQVAESSPQKAEVAELQKTQPPQTPPKPQVESPSLQKAEVAKPVQESQKAEVAKQPLALTKAQESQESKSAEVAKPPPQKTEESQVAKPPPKESQESRSVEVAKQPPTLQQAEEAQVAKSQSVQTRKPLRIARPNESAPKVWFADAKQIAEADREKPDAPIKKAAAGTRHLTQDGYAKVLTFLRGGTLPLFPLVPILPPPADAKGAQLQMWEEIAHGNRRMYQAALGLSVRKRNHHLDAALKHYARARLHQRNDYLCQNFGLAHIAKALHTPEPERKPHFRAAADMFVSGNAARPHYFDFMLAVLYALADDGGQCRKWLQQSALPDRDALRGLEFGNVRGQKWFAEFSEFDE